MSKLFNIRLLEIAGMVSALEALHLPFGKDCASGTSFKFGEVNGKLSTQSFADMNPKDIQLMQRLANNGDEHAKVLRGIIVWLEIDAPRYLWQEIDTYRVGTDRLASESTMHMQCKGMNTDELLAAKAGLTEGTMQKRVQMFSYQTLRRMYFQRKNHRLPQWKEFCAFVENLPLAKELITTVRASGKLKCFKNVSTESYGGGWLLVAAESAEQAHEVAMQADSLEFGYWENGYLNEQFEYIDGRRNTDNCTYKKDNWLEVVGLEYSGKPCVIDEHSYRE